VVGMGCISMSLTAGLKIGQGSERDVPVGGMVGGVGNDRGTTLGARVRILPAVGKASKKRTPRQRELGCGSGDKQNGNYDQGSHARLLVPTRRDTCPDGEPAVQL